MLYEGQHGFRLGYYVNWLYEGEHRFRPGYSFEFQAKTVRQDLAESLDRETV